jgi:hypothetical protein
LGRTEVWLLVLGNIVLTPLLGLAVWWGWRERHAKAADRVLWLTLPFVALFGTAWTALVVLSTGG